MKVQKFIQGERETDMKLFGLLGSMLTSVATHEALGVCPSSIAGDVWFLAVENDIAKGFLLLRPMKSQKGHIRYLYAEHSSAPAMLIKAAITEATALKLASIYTKDRYSAIIWQKFNFLLGEKPARGQFTHWEKVL